MIKAFPGRLKSLAVLTLNIGTVALIAACASPMPPDVAAEQSEKFVVCPTSPVKLFAPAMVSDLVSTWQADLSSSCPTSQIAIVDSAAAADVVISANSIPTDCAPKYSATFAVDGATPVAYFSDETQLNLSPATLQKIISGEITQWDDPEVVAENPDATVPAMPITVVADSWKTASDALGTWISRLTNAPWQNNPVAFADNFDPEIALTALSVDGAFGIVPASFAVNNSLSAINLITEEGAEPLTVSPDAILSASTQLAQSANDQGLSVPVLDPAIAPASQAGQEQVITPWQGIYVLQASECQSADEMSALAFIRFILRIDEQAQLQGFAFTQIPDSMRMSIVQQLQAKLPTPTAQPTDVAVPSEVPVTDTPTDAATDVATPEPSVS